MTWRRCRPAKKARHDADGPGRLLLRYASGAVEDLAGEPRHVGPGAVEVGQPGHEGSGVSAAIRVVRENEAAALCPKICIHVHQCPPAGSARREWPRRRPM
ncbi:hypothetical protein [Nakamurella sp. PAMC28650]|uniref:hypothetical protein n=1 Tax=Nakamurella sp. PAMC28650 TaxID=2762325 RepID=UPI00164DFC94|nr:hypothetical protein [Nakamurella sp. PAMC28650]QNK81065.1 hypothetical protein H7F38_23855 [Nakamurella sp. PAMC28650]